jgi:hypothetical protein
VSSLVPFAGLGLNEAVTPLGSPDVTPRLTLPVKPPTPVTVMVVEAELPCSTVRLGGEDVSTKFIGAGGARASTKF